MSVLVSDVIWSARDILLDNGIAYTAWSDTTLERWLNDVLAEAATLKRDISPQVIPVPLVAGSVQQLPLNALILLQPYFNVASGNAINVSLITPLQLRVPRWRSLPPTTDIVDVMFDERSPLVFHCYPPSDGTGSIMALCGVTPALAPIGCLPISNALIPVPDNYRSALVDGIVSKAYGANTRRQDITKANYYWQRFQAGITGAKMAQREVVPVPSEGTREGA